MSQKIYGMDSKAFVQWFSDPTLEQYYMYEVRKIHSCERLVDVFHGID